MSRIATIEARTVLCPLPQPLRLASRTVDARAFTLVRVHDDDGAVGTGFTFAGYRNSDLATRAVALLAPLALGRPVDATAGLWEAMAHGALLEGRAGAAMRALSAIDIALWDLRGRRAGLPLHRLHGAVELTSVPAYLAGGYFTDGGEPALLAEVDEQLAAGATTVKVKIGAGSAADDVARVRAVRARTGDGVALIADANGRWRSVAEALPVARALAALDLRYLEDPSRPSSRTSTASCSRRAACRSRPARCCRTRASCARWRPAAASACSSSTRPPAAASPASGGSPPGPRSKASASTPTGSPSCTRRSPRRSPATRSSSTSATTARCRSHASSAAARAGSAAACC